MYVAASDAVSAHSVGMHRSCIRIGDVSIGLTADSPDDVEPTREMKRFRTTRTDCDIDIRVQWMDRLQDPSGRKVFDSGSVWILHEKDGGFVFDFASPV